MPPSHEPGADDESVRERVERLIVEGRLTRDAVREAERVWAERLRHGVRMASGQSVHVSLGDLYHAIVDSRIARKPWRIETMIAGIYELRTAESDRMLGLTRWIEETGELQGYVILTSERTLRSVHVVDERRLRKLARRGERLWPPP